MVLEVQEREGRPQRRWMDSINHDFFNREGIMRKICASPGTLFDIKVEKTQYERECLHINSKIIYNRYLLVIRKLFVNTSKQYMHIV